MRILLFGSDGRLGTALQRVFPHHDWIALTKADADLTDPAAIAAVIRAHPADLVFNAAAYNAVDEAEIHEALAMQLNAEAPGCMAQTAAELGIRFVHVSSDYVFDGTSADGYTEADEPRPISAYGRSKFQGERSVLEANPQAVVIRTSRLFGPPGSGEGKKSFVEIVLELAKREPTFSINAAEISAPTLVDDLARHLETFVFTDPEASGMYHMSNLGGCTWYEWAVEIVKQAGLSATITPRDPDEQPRAAKRPNYSILRSTRIPPMRPWQEALKEYLASYV